MSFSGITTRHAPQWLVLLFLGSIFANVRSWSRDGFVESIVSEYQKHDQSGRADTTRDGLITDAEFAYNLYNQADAQGNSDNQVSRDEFLDYYTHNYNVSSELATLMFDSLNDPSNGDDVIKPNDVSLLSFSGRKFATVNEYRSGLEKWIRQSADKLYTILMSPHTIDTRSEPEIRFNVIVDSIDTNKDNILTLGELNEELQRIGSNAPVRRRDWVRRNTQRYGADPITANLVFDYWDRDGDLSLTSRDLQYMTEDMDLNVDSKLGVDEFVRFVERGYKLSRRMTGAPLPTTMVVCPDPWWSSLGWTANIDATRATMDLDDDLNGWITVSDLTRWLHIFDDDGDGSISRREYANIQAQRYGVNATVASAMFDLADTTGDDKLDSLDWEQHFKGDFSVSFCDAKRSIQDLVRMAERFRGLRQGREMREAMRKRLQEELTYYRQNTDRQSLGRSNAVGRGAGGSSRCAGKVTCYLGESTEAWWVGEAWLWWSVKITDQRMGPGTPTIDGFRPEDGGYHSMPVITPPLGRGMVGPVMGDTAHPYPPHQWSPMFDMGNMAHMGGMGPFQPYKRSTDKQLSSKTGQINRSSNSNSPLFSDYQRLYNPYSQSSQAPTANPINSDSDVYTDNLDVNKGTPEDAAAVTANNIESSNGPRSSFHDASDSQQNETPAATKKTDAKKKGGKGSYDDELPPFPVLGYPVLVGFDPWMMNGGPNWSMFGRMKRGESDESGSSREKRDASEENREDKDDKEGERRDETPPIAGQDEDSIGPSNSSDPLDSVMGWAPGLMPPPLPGFALTPWDLWMAWSLETALWDAMHPNQWNDTTGNTSSSSGNETRDDETWEEMMRWVASQNEESLSPESSGENDRRELFNDATEKNDEERRDRDKRFIQDGNTFNWPAFWNYWTRSSPSFGNYWPRFRPFGDSGGRFSGYGFIGPWDRWMRYRNWNFPTNRFDFTQRIKRSSEDQAKVESASEDAERELRSDSPETSRREFSFDKWKDNSRDPSKNPKITSDDKKDSIWRSSSSKYGTENDWQQQLNSASSQWNLGAKEQYGTQKWSNGKLSTSLQQGQQGDWLTSLISSSKGDWKKPFGGQSFDGRLENAFPQSPTNIFRNIVPRTMLASFIPQKPGSWPDWGGYFDAFNSFDSRHALKFTNPSMWLDFPDFPNFLPGGNGADFANWFPGTGDLDRLDEFFSLWNNRFVRGTESKNSETEDIKWDQAENLEGSRNKRNAGDTARNKRWGFPEFTGRQPMPNWVNWFYPWCQQWGRGRFPRDANEKTGADDDDDPEKRSSQPEREKGKRWGYGYMDRPAPGFSSYNYDSMYTNWAWICPQVWRAIQSYNNRWSFYAGRASSTYQQFRKKRDVAATDSEQTLQAEDARLKRWDDEEWNWFGDDEDCNYPMPAWTPWRGWNMLRSARGGDLKGPLTAENIKGSIPRSPPVKKGVRCKSWYKKGQNDADFGYGNQNAWSGSGNRWGDDSSWNYDRFGDADDNKNTFGSSWRTKRATEATRTKRQGMWNGFRYPFGNSLDGQWWNPYFFYYNSPWRSQWYNGFSRWLGGFPGNYMRRLRDAGGVAPSEENREKREATEEGEEGTREKRNLWSQWGGYPNNWWANRFNQPWSSNSQFWNPYPRNSWLHLRQRREATGEAKDDDRDKRSFPWNAGPTFGNNWMSSYSRPFPWWFYRYGNAYEAARFPREAGGEEANNSEDDASKNKRWIGGQWPHGWPSNNFYSAQPWWSTQWNAQPWSMSWYGSMRWPRVAPENTDETRSKRSTAGDDEGKQLQDRSLFNNEQGKSWQDGSLFNNEQGKSWQDGGMFNNEQGKSWQDGIMFNKDQEKQWQNTGLFSNVLGKKWQEPKQYNDAQGKQWPDRNQFNDAQEKLWPGRTQFDDAQGKQWQGRKQFNDAQGKQWPDPNAVPRTSKSLWNDYNNNYGSYWSRFMNSYPFSSQPQFSPWGFSNWNPPLANWPYKRSTRSTPDSPDVGVTQEDTDVSKRWAQYPWWRSYSSDWGYDPSSSYYQGFGSTWNPNRYSNPFSWPRFTRHSENGQAAKREKRSAEEDNKEKRWADYGWNGWPSTWQRYPYEDWSVGRWGGGFYDTVRYPRGSKASEQSSGDRSKRDAERSKRWPSWGYPGNWQGRYSPFYRWSNEQYPYDWWSSNFQNAFRFPRNLKKENSEQDDPRYKRATEEEKPSVEDGRNTDDSDNRTKRWWSDGGMFPWSNYWQNWPRRMPYSWTPQSPWGEYGYNNRYRRQVGGQGAELLEKKEDDASRLKRWNYWPWTWSNQMWSPNSLERNGWFFSNWGNGDFMRYGRGARESDGGNRNRREAETDRSKRWQNPWWGPQSSWTWNWDSGLYPDSPYINRFENRFWRRETDNKKEDGFAERTKREVVEDSSRQKRWLNWYNNFSPYWRSGWDGRGIFLLPLNNVQFWDPRFFNRFVVRRAASETGNGTEEALGNEEAAGTEDGQARTRRWQNWSGYPFFNWQNFGFGGAPWWVGSNFYGLNPRYSSMMYRWNPWYNHLYGFNRYQRDSDVSDDDTADDSTRKKRDAENDSVRDKRWFGGGNAFGGHWNSYWGNEYNSFDSWPGGDRWWTGDFDYQRYARDNKDDRQKRSADADTKSKRWGEWATGGDWMSWYVNRNQPPYSGSYNFWNRVQSPSSFFSPGRFKRGAGDTNRDKRWYNDFYYPYWSNGYSTFDDSWNSWPGFFGDRFSRQTATTEDTKEVNARVKRYQPWVFPFTGHNAFPWGFSGSWGQMPGMSYSNWYNPYMSGSRNYIQRWNPWFRNYFWNARRSARRSDSGGSTDKEQGEAGIALEKNSREKRWAGNFGGSGPWSRGSSPPWSYRSGNPWYDYSNFGGSPNSYWNRFSNYYPGRPIRGTDNAETDHSARSKREASTESDRSKRWYGNSPGFYNWNSQGWSTWDPYRASGSQWNWNPWSFAQAYSKRSPAEEGEVRSKRGVDDDGRDKRWWRNDPQNYDPMHFYSGVNSWGNSHPAFAPWSYYNYPISRVKRNPGSEQDRDKRWLYGGYKYNDHFWGWDNYNWNRWNQPVDWRYSNYAMRWPRNLENDKKESLTDAANAEGIKDGDVDDGVRQKRDTESSDRGKRWGDYLSNPFSSYPWQDGYWGSNPWSSTQRWMDYMRYPRGIPGSEETSATKNDAQVTDTLGNQDNPTAGREKRWGNWNVSPYGGPGFSDGLRNLLYRTRFQSGTPSYSPWSWWNRNFPYK